MSSEKFLGTKKCFSISPHHTLLLTCTCIFGSRFFCCCDYTKTPTHLYHTAHHHHPLHCGYTKRNFKFYRLYTDHFLQHMDWLLTASLAQFQDGCLPLAQICTIFFNQDDYDCWTITSHNYSTASAQHALRAFGGFDLHLTCASE